MSDAYRWTDGTGYNFYYDPPHGQNKATATQHPFWCSPSTEKRRLDTLKDGDDVVKVGKRNRWSEVLEDINDDALLDLGPGDSRLFFYNILAVANVVPWPANDVDSVTNVTCDNAVVCDADGRSDDGSLLFSNILGYPGYHDPEGPFTQIGDDFTETYLPNGETNAGDATAPEWRIDFRIQPNGSAKGKNKGSDATDGAGMLVALDKHFRAATDKNGDWKVWNDDPFGDREGPGHTAAAEEQTSPFYHRSIPNLGDGEAGTGTTLAEFNNNTVGYITDDEDGVNPGDSFDYPLWDFLHEATLDQNRGANTNCVEYFYPDTSIGAYTPTFRTTPTGPDLAAVYADEHGVGEVTLKPGTGFYFNQLPWKRNTQKGCDLQGIEFLGTSTVIATAYYPDKQPVGYKQVNSNAVTKWWTNGFNVQMAYVAKGGNNDGYQMTVWKTDITGNTPERKEIVCVSTPNGGEVSIATLISIPAKQIALNPQVHVTDVPGIVQGPSRICAEMQEQPGQTVASAIFDVRGALPMKVLANVVTEQIKRQITINKKTHGGNPPPTDGDGKPIKPGTLPKKAVPTTAQLKDAGLLTTQRIAKVNRVKYKKVRVNGKVKKGKVLVKVQGPTTKVRLKLSLMGVNKKGSWVAMRTIRKTVKANTKKFVKVKVVRPALLAKRVKRVDVRIVRLQGRLIS